MPVLQSPLNSDHYRQLNPMVQHLVMCVVNGTTPDTEDCSPDDFLSWIEFICVKNDLAIPKQLFAWIDRFFQKLIREGQNRDIFAFLFKVAQHHIFACMVEGSVDLAIDMCCTHLQYNVKWSHLEELNVWLETQPDSAYRRFIEALCFAGGFGREQDFTRAHELFYQNWMDHHHVYSGFNAAMNLFEGKGVEVDYVRAFALFKTLSEDYQHAGSLFMYAECLYQGKGDRKDPVQARALWWRGWDQYRYEDSLKQYIWCLERGVGGEKNQNRGDELRALLN